MKLEPQNDNYLTVAVYVLICALVISLFAVALFNLEGVGEALGTLWKILKPVAYGIVFAGIIYTPANFFEERVFAFLDRIPRAPQRLPKRLSRFVWRLRSVTHRNRRFKRGCALALTYALILATLCGFMLIVAPQIAQSYSELSTVAPEYLATAQRWLDDMLDKLPFTQIDTGIDLPGDGEPAKEALESALADFGNPLALTVQQAQGNGTYRLVRQMRTSGLTLDLSEMMSNTLETALGLMRSAVPQILDFFAAVMTEVKNIALGLIISVYMLYSREKLPAQVRKYLCAWLPVGAVDALAKVGRITGRIFTEFVTGKIIDAIVIGVLCTFSMFVFRMPYAPLIGLLVGVTNVIPFLGPFLGAVPGAIIIFIVNPVKAIWFVLLIVVLQQLDSNFIEPYIVGSKTGLPSVYIVTSVIIMGGIFGVVGLFLGVPAFAVIYALVKEWSESRLTAKSLPTATAAYAESTATGAD